MTNKTATKNFSWWDVPKSIWYFLEEDKKKFSISAIVLSLMFVYVFVPAYLVGKIVDFFVNYKTGDSLKLFYGYSFLLGGSYIIVALIRLTTKQNISIIYNKAKTRARVWGFERLTEFSLEWHQKENTGNKLQRIFTGADAIKGWMSSLTRDIIQIFVNIFGSLIIFALTDFKIGVLIVVYLILFCIVEFSLSPKIYKLSNEVNALNQSAGGVYVESASNMLSVKALGGEEGLRQRVASREELTREKAIMRAIFGFRRYYFFRTIDGLILIIFMLFVGNAVMKGVITVGSILTLFTYFYKLRDSLTDFSEQHSTFIDLKSDLGNMMPLFWETDFVKTGNAPFPKDWDKIELKNVSMDYGSGQMGLENLSLTLKRNTKTGIAGLSGSGKSTLAKIILGLYALQKGEFKIGNKNYYSISHNETLSHITVVLQETELFNLSLRDNITMMRGEDPELLEQAIEISQLKEVISRLPQGLDALIGEKGYMLSGGERQRLGIARAIYKNSSIIILDEATSSLDSETEGRIMEKLLGEYGEDKTFLIIAHRLGTLKYTDNIAVMERGQVVEEGSYATLMNTSSSVFYRLNKQSKEEVTN